LIDITFSASMSASGNTGTATTLDVDAVIEGDAAASGSVTVTPSWGQGDVHAQGEYSCSGQSEVVVY
jgi:hypothetical protein